MSKILHHHRAFAFKLSVRNTVTRVQPSDLCQFTHIKSILSLGCVGNWMCVSTVEHKMTQPEKILSPWYLFTVYMWMGLTVGMVYQLSGQNKALIPACSLVWLLWHKGLSLLHFILTVWSSFTPSYCFFTSSWSKQQLPTCPWLVNHEQRSINHYCFSSCFCKALGQGFTPSWHRSWSSRIRAFPKVQLTSITLSYINQRSVWQDFNCYGLAGGLWRADWF